MRACWLVGIAVVGCGGESGDDGTTPEGYPRACDESSVDGDCILYSGEDWTEDDIVGYCASGTLLDACPTDALVGTCTVDGGTGFETVTSFYTPFWNGNGPAQACSGQGGTFGQP